MGGERAGGGKQMKERGRREAGSDLLSRHCPVLSCLVSLRGRWRVSLNPQHRSDPWEPGTGPCPYNGTCDQTGQWAHDHHHHHTGHIAMSAHVSGASPPLLISPHISFRLTSLSCRQSGSKYLRTSSYFVILPQILNM